MAKIAAILYQRTGYDTMGDCFKFVIGDRNGIGVLKELTKSGNLSQLTEFISSLVRGFDMMTTSRSN